MRDTEKAITNENETMFITTAGLLKRIPICRKTAYNWVKKGRLPVCVVGRKQLFHWPSCEQALLRPAARRMPVRTLALRQSHDVTVHSSGRRKIFPITSAAPARNAAMGCWPNWNRHGCSWINVKPPARPRRWSSTSLLPPRFTQAVSAYQRKSSTWLQP